jgi:hypothetical protein
MTSPATFHDQFLVAQAPSLDTCANPTCPAKFKKLGEGVLFAKSVDDALAWGLPHGKKQKVVWLCAECAKNFNLVFDRSKKQVLLHPRQRGRGAAA